MKFREAQASGIDAMCLIKPSHLTKDDIFKKYWDDLADDWLALENAMNEKDVHGKPMQRH